MELASILGIGLVAAVLAVALRQIKPEYALFVSIGCGVLMLLWAVQSLEPVLKELSALLGSTKLAPEFGSILLKALGVSFIAQFASDACRDAGEVAIASKIELCGRIAIVLLSLPMFREILSIAGMLFSL